MLALSLTAFDPKPTSYASHYGAMDRTSLACSEVTGEGWAVFTWSTERGDSLPRMHRATHILIVMTVRLVRPKLAHFSNIKSTRRFMEAINCCSDAVRIRLLGPGYMADSWDCAGGEQAKNQIAQATSIHGRLRQ
jgi:hypothetical protein